MESLAKECTRLKQVPPSCAFARIFFVRRTQCTRHAAGLRGVLQQVVLGKVSARRHYARVRRPVCRVQRLPQGERILPPFCCPLTPGSYFGQLGMNKMGLGNLLTEAAKITDPVVPPASAKNAKPS